MFVRVDRLQVELPAPEKLGRVERVSNGDAILANGPDKQDADVGDCGDISNAAFAS
jgi:hypothetical protein